MSVSVTVEYSIGKKNKSVQLNFNENSYCSDNSLCTPNFFEVAGKLVPPPHPQFELRAWTQTDTGTDPDPDADRDREREREREI